MSEASRLTGYRDGEIMEQSAEKTRILAELEKLEAEGLKLRAEVLKYRFEAMKLEAEAGKLNRESRWYPFVLVTAMVGLVEGLARLLH